MIKFPGDDQLKDSSRQSYGAFGEGGVERFSALNASTVSVTNLNASNITSGTIDASTITVTNIDAGNISTGTLSADRIGADSITASKIAGNTITASEIAGNTITAGEIAGNTITASQIASGTITANEISTGTITASQIASHTITGSELTTSLIDVTSLSADSIAVGIAASYNGLYVTNGCYFTKDSSNNNIYYHTGLNNYDIYDIRDAYAYNYYPRCEVAEGIDPFEVMQTFEPEEQEKGKKKTWKKLDHSKLHKEIYKKAKLDDKKDEITEAYSLNKLVELQRQAILQLKEKIDKLEAQVVQ